MSQSNAQRLADLIRAHVSGKAMPETIKTADGAAVPLADWLTGLQNDRSQFDRHEASLIDVAARPAQTNEIAFALRARLAASNTAATSESSPAGTYTRAGASEARADILARVSLTGSSQTALP